MLDFGNLEDIRNENHDNVLDFHDEHIEVPNHEPHQQILCEEFFVNKFLKLFARKDTSLQVAVDHIDLIKEIIKSAEIDILQKLQPIPEAMEAIESYFSKIMHSVSTIDTQYKLESHLKNLGYFEEAKKVVIHYNEDDIKLTLFPLKNRIQNFMQLPNVLNNIINNQMYLRQKSLDDNGLYNIINGPLWESVLNQHSNDDVVIPLLLYCDDFNPDNGLGPHKLDTELSSFYISFPTLPDYVNNNTDHILIAMMTKSRFLKKYTNIILLRLVDQMRELEQGITVDIGNGPRRIYFNVIVIVGDNMALNCIEGFPRSLNCNGFCRVCTKNQVDWSIATHEDPNLLRNEVNYILGEHGVRQISILNNIAHHRVYNNQTVDVTHDWKLGIYKHDLFLIFNYVLCENNLREINEVIQGFDYGSKDLQYRIPEITDHIERNKSFPGYAREIWNTVNYLPFILSHFLDFDNVVYKFGLLMVDILDELLKPKADIDYSRNLDELIKKHNRSVIDLFNVTLKPKNHIATHYGRISLKVGPLKNLCTLPFERKHQTIKSYLVNDKNRMNTTFSVSKKIAYEEAFLFYNRTNIFQNIKSHGKFLNGEPLHYNGAINLPDMRMVKKVEYKGTTYMLGDYIFSNDKATVNNIKEILISLRDDAAYLVTEKFNIIYVDEFRSYKLCDSLREFQTMNILDYDFPPINKHYFREEYYLRFKYF